MVILDQNCRMALVKLLNGIEFIPQHHCVQHALYYSLSLMSAWDSIRIYRVYQKKFTVGKCSLI